MPKFAYLGDHAAVTLWGIEFPQGVAVDVDSDPAIAKLRGNPHFSEVLDGVEVLPPEPTAEPRQKRKYTRKAA